MTIGIVVSRADSASAHVGEHLRGIEEWEPVGGGATDSSVDHVAAGATDASVDHVAAGAVDDAAGSVDAYRAPGFELRYFDDWHLELEGAAETFDADLDALVFASRHSGGTGPILTAHFTGNFGDAEHGGEDRSLAEASARAASRVLKSLGTYAPKRYDVGMECTHHGPTTVGVPSMFVEVGSDEAQWADPEAAKAAARAILDLDGVTEEGEHRLVAFGGGHYAPRATRIALETDWAVGHIAADWCLEDLGDPAEHRDVVDAVFQRSGAEFAVVDGEKPDLRGVIEGLGYRVVSETWVQETAGVSLALADSLEAALTSIDDGLRFGTPAASTDDAAALVRRDLPDGLWADARSVDPDAAIAAAREHAVAYETAENGNRVEGEGVFADDEAYDAFVDALAGLLEEKYDRVERTKEEVVVEAEGFDPERAGALGIPEGPKFGQLAAGRTITVDGEEVTPADVTTRQTNTYRV